MARNPWSMKSELMRLRGMDYFQVLIDHHIKKHGGKAHQARIFLLLNDKVSRGEVESVIHADPAISWICNLRLTFTWLHAYARISAKAGEVGMPISDMILLPGQQWEAFVEDHHADLAIKSPIILQLFYFPDGKTGMLFTFNHILFDYQGIEHFLNRFSNGINLPIIGVYPKTTGFRSRTIEFFRAIAYAFRMGGHSIFSTRSSGVALQQVQTEFRTTCFSQDELAKFKSNVASKGLELQESIYLLAISAMVIYWQLGNAESRERKLLFQLPVSQRTKKNKGGLLFNALSFLYFNLEPHLMRDLDLIINRLSGQMKEQIKAGLPRAFLTFSDIYKVIPFNIYRWMLGLPTKGQLGSFNISILGNTFKDMDQFMGRSIHDVMNFPSNTIQPGLTLVFYAYRGELRMTTSWVKGEFDQQEQMAFHQSLKEGLLDLGVVAKRLE